MDVAVACIGQLFHNLPEENRKPLKNIKKKSW
jgi:hypothetical protein